MAVLSPNQIAGYVIQAGWSGNDVVTGTAVALAESGGKTDIIGPANSNGTRDYGLFQINSIHKPTDKDWQNPVVNAQMAKGIWEGRKKATGNGWQAWSAYSNGRYLLFMAQATAAAKSPEGGQGVNPTPTGTEPSGAGTADISGIAKFMELLSNPQTWWRVGYFIAGGFMFLFGLYTVIGNTKTGEAVQGFALKAAKVAVLKKI